MHVFVYLIGLFSSVGSVQTWLVHSCLDGTSTRNPYNFVISFLVILYFPIVACHIYNSTYYPVFIKNKITSLVWRLKIIIMLSNHLNYIIDFQVTLVEKEKTRFKSTFMNLVCQSMNRGSLQFICYDHQ